MSKRDETTAATAWLSCDLAVFADRLGLATRAAGERAPADVDVLIVGSGYGASIALDALAGCRDADGNVSRIAMLERGREFVPGAFPSSEADLAGEARFSTAGTGTVRGQASGLFDLRLGKDVNVLLASGLGGGSLINAGVMEPPLASVFQDPRWPRAVRERPPSSDEFRRVQDRLLAAPSSPFSSRVDAMGRVAGAHAQARPVHVTVAAADDPAREVRRCIQCGDCATGCNFKAKLSVDVSLIAEARRRHPDDRLDVVTGATVVDLRARKDGGWEVDVVHTARDLRRHQATAYRVRATRVIVAAGTLGSTELLLRARESGLKLSPRLGAGFSTNGDLISLVCDTGVAAHAVADETQPFTAPERSMGPTITRMIDARADPALRAVIQDLGAPGPLRRLFEESAATGLTMDSLTRTNGTSYRRGQAVPDPAGIDKPLIARSLAVAVIGDDDASGHLTLPARTPALEQGTLGVVWPELRSEPRQDARQDAFERFVRGNIPGSKVLPNPVWRPLAAPLEAVFGPARGPAITVHPLGGCSMGDSFDTGVVNANGEVFSGSPGDPLAVHAGLVVLDGAIVPTALGINPSLTISVIAMRAMATLKDEDHWNLTAVDAAPNTLAPRPTYAIPQPVPAQPTRLAVTELMKATLQMATPNGARPCAIELELWFDEVAVPDLVGADAPRTLRVNGLHSELRIQAAPGPVVPVLPIDPRHTAPELPAAREYLVRAPVSGTLTLFRHDTSRPPWRTLRALCVWTLNRGLRDLWQALEDFGMGRPRSNTAGPIAMIRSAWRLASHAGATRLLEYDLRIGSATVDAGGLLGTAGDWTHHAIRARKRIAFEIGGNPVRQLMEATLEEFPRVASSAGQARLVVDPTHFGHTGVPLVRIARQRNSPAALLDLGSLGAYIARVLLPVHLWYLRLPDRSRTAVRRLPPDLARERAFAPLAITELEVGRSKDAGVVRIRLSRYRPAKVTHDSPVLLLHGYSASGTTFVHPSLPGGGLVGALCEAGHDVWVLDMRSSAGMPTCQVHWKFEQMGCSDIPIAVNHVLESTGAARVDVVAHCMGTAMLTLGLTLPVEQFDPKDGLDVALTRKMRKRLGRIVFSQAGPALTVKPANLARSYIFQWIRHYVPLGPYEFTPAAPDTADDMLDRLLSAVPYPAREFRRENPRWRFWKRTPWVGARHRMDALYGITFDLAGVDDAVLESIDDFFGPLHVGTVAQVIGFARAKVVTDAQGGGDFNVPGSFPHAPHARVLSLHATENGLFDLGTRQLVAQYLAAAGLQGQAIALEGFGHQDSLIGRNAAQVYKHIVDFLA